MRWLPARLAGMVKAARTTGTALCLLLLCLIGASAHSQAVLSQLHPPPVMLDEAASPLLDPPPAGEWLDVGGKTTLDQVLAGAASFSPMRADRIHSLGSDALWLHLRIVRPADSHMQWLAEVPLPPVDRVTMFQQDSHGAWRGRSAGDKLPVSSWPEPARFPVFHLEVPAGEARDVYLRVQHNARAHIPLRIASVSNHSQRMQFAYLGLGLVFGGLALLIAACIAQGWVFRDRAFFGYAAYASTIALAMAAYTGAGAHLLWPNSGFIADVAQGALGMLSAAAAILFVRDLSGIAAHRPGIGAFARWTAWSVPLLVALYLVIDRPLGTYLLGAYMALTIAINTMSAWISWRRGDKPSAWILVAYGPLALAVVLTLLRLFGLAPTSWANQYGLVAAMMVQVPLLLIALSLHARERHGATIRELALSSQDALTGVLAAHLFHDRLRQLLARHKRHGESAAVLFIDLANYGKIKEQHGSAIAEQSLVRSVIKLRRLLREIDTLSRIGEARFGVILERMGSRVPVTDRAAQVVASGMQPMKGQKPDVGLEFHVAAALLGEISMDAAELSAGLAGLLDSMSPRTRRPIRFLRAPLDQDEPEGDSVAPAEDSGLPLSQAPP